MRSRSECLLRGTRPCAFPHPLLRNRPHHLRLEFQSRRRLRKALWRCLRHPRTRRYHRIRRHRRMSLRRETVQPSDRQMLPHPHPLMTRRWISPALPRTTGHHRRTTDPGRSASLQAGRPNLRWLLRSGKWIEAGSSWGVSRPQIFRRFSKTPAGRHLRCRPGSRCALLDLKFYLQYYILNGLSTKNFLYLTGVAERASPADRRQFPCSALHFWRIPAARARFRGCARHLIWLISI